MRDPWGMARKAAPFVVPALFFVYIFSVTMNIPLNDPDVWWHLKTGDYIIDNWEVPEVDPFAYTTPRPLSLDQKIGLRSQWLGQVIFYLAYRAGGFFGVGVLRNLLIITPMVLLFVWLLRRGASMWAAFCVSSLPAAFLSIQLFYAFERPQGLSFNIVAVLIILLERARRKAREGRSDASLLFIPVLTALWSNIHAAFIVGNIIVMIYASAEAITALYHRARKTGAPSVGPLFYAACAASILASFLNPNSYHLFYSYFSGLASMFVTDLSRTFGGGGDSWVREIVLEYKPLVYFYRELHYEWLVFYWAFTALVYAGLIVKYALRRSFDMAEFFTVTLVAVFANMYARGLMFSLTVMPFFLGKTVLELRHPGGRRVFLAVSKVLAALSLLVFIAFSTYTYKRSPSFFEPGVTESWVTPWYPTLLADFLKSNPVAPPMYNYYTWGGFMIWNLYPQYQVFIDGRAIDNLVNRTADAILKIFPGWREQLDAYGVNFIAIPVIFRESGHVIPLAVALAYDEDWKLVFVKNNSVLFVRDVPKNREVIRLYNRDKDYVFLEMLKVSEMFIGASPNNPVYNVSKADALYCLGRAEEAEQIYRRFPEEAMRREAQMRYMQSMRKTKK